MQSCSTEETLIQKNEATIKTVSREQAIQFLQQNPLRTSIKKATKTNNSPNYNAISQEEISNSDQFLTLIPLLNNDKTQHSRIVLLTINDTLKNAIFTMYPDGEQKTKDFSGRLMITSLSGEFKNGFRVKDGFLVSQFVLKINGAKSTGTNKSASDDLGTILNEVIIPPRKKATIQINYIFDSSSPVYDNSTPDSFTWDFEKYGGGGGASAEAEAEPVVEEEEEEEDIVAIGPDPEKVIDKINEYLKCFDLNKSAEVIIYVDQPLSNNSKAWSGTDVGHTFIAIQQGKTRRVFGYWPATSIYPAPGYSTDNMVFGNDENHHFDVSLSTPVDANKLFTIIAYANNAPKVYDLDNYNCTDFAIEVGKIAGLPLSNSYGAWPGGAGSNPGQFGQDIRNMTLPANSQRQTTEANAASNKGTCN